MLHTQIMRINADFLSLIRVLFVMLICKDKFLCFEPCLVFVWLIRCNISIAWGKELSGFKNTLVLHECCRKTYQVFIPLFWEATDKILKWAANYTNLCWFLLKPVHIIRAIAYSFFATNFHELPRNNDPIREN